jgi:hypothetical protein
MKQVLAANKEAKRVNNVLDEDSDTFVKNECAADKWMIIELSQVRGRAAPGLGAMFTRHFY